MKKIKCFLVEIKYPFWKGNKCKFVHHWNNIKNELLIFSFGQNINKILNLKVDICATFWMKNGLN
jgi:hypothetical protein